jgi:hypothetical protein
MRKALDDLSKNLASGMSRRRALMLFGGSVMAVFLGDRAAGSAYAWQVYPNSTQCFVNQTQNNQGDDNCQGDENQ